MFEVIANNALASIRLNNGSARIANKWKLLGYYRFAVRSNLNSPRASQNRIYITSAKT